MAADDRAATLARFKDQWAVALVTYRRDGTPVSTPVNIAVVDGRAFFRTWRSSGKAKRLRHNPAVTVAPSTAVGRLTGEAIPGKAHQLTGDEAKFAQRAIAGKHGILQRFFVPWFHWLTRKKTQHYEFVPDWGNPV